MVAVSSGRVCVDRCYICFSSIVSSADDVLEKSVVRGMMRGVGGVCEMCM